MNVPKPQRSAKQAVGSGSHLIFPLRPNQVEWFTQHGMAGVRGHLPGSSTAQHRDGTGPRLPWRPKNSFQPALLGDFQQGTKTTQCQGWALNSTIVSLQPYSLYHSACVARQDQITQ